MENWLFLFSSIYLDSLRLWVRWISWLAEVCSQLISKFYCRIDLNYISLHFYMIWTSYFEVFDRHCQFTIIVCDFEIHFRRKPQIYFTFINLYFFFRSNSTGFDSRKFIDGRHSTAATKFQNNEIVSVKKWASKTIPWFIAFNKIIYSPLDLRKLK